MYHHRFVKTTSLLVLAAFSLSLGANQALAQKNKVKDPNSVGLKSRDPNAIKARQKQRVTNEQRQAAAARAAAKRAPGQKGPTPIGATPSAIVPGPLPVPSPGATPDYFGGVTPNWAWTPLVHKFVDKLPGLTSAGANGLGQYIPLAVADTTTYPGSDYYEIGVVQYKEQMHTELPPTTLRGYVQLSTSVVPGSQIPLFYPDGITPILVGGVPATAVDKPHYLGPTIVATKDKPVRIKFVNLLPAGMSGDLFIPVDTTDMGAGMGPNMVMPATATPVSGSLVALTYPSPLPAGFTPFVAGEMVMLTGFTPSAYNGAGMVQAGASAAGCQIMLKTAPSGAGTGGSVTAMFTENRATLHLHGGLTPWISDGTPHQWTTPAGESTSYPKGVSVKNVPDMPDPGPGAITFFYTNQQSARLMFYHDHAWGITRLNVYAGEAAGYVLTDATEQDLIARGILPDIGIPLIIQDRTFVDANTLPTTDPTWNWGSQPGQALTGDLWYPHVYMPNQNPNDPGGTNAMGRWDYGPFFWPPWPTKYLPYTDSLGLLEPNLPTPSMTMEAFHDTPIVNGTLYPYLEVDPKTYRFRILNAANDRMWNLQLYQASSIVGGITLKSGGSGYTTVPMVTIEPNAVAGDTTGHGASALATIDPATGQVTALTLVSVGSGYTANPKITIAPPASGTPATASATFYGALPTEVGMVPAVPGAANFPVGWTIQTVGQPGDVLDSRAGGVPDPAMMGPSIIQIGTEGGFLPAPVVWPNTPVGFERNPKDIVVTNVKEHNLFLGPAERADVLIDFSAFAGKTLILYNDAGAAVPAPDSRLDYYTGDYEQTAVGGHAPTLPGFGPNTRTIMQIRVKGVPTAGLPLASIALTAPGAGYTAPVVTIDPPTSGIQATATATADPITGAITSITLTAPGSGYTAAPLVNISDSTGPGTGATAGATLAAPAAYNLAALKAEFATDPVSGAPGVFARSQDPILVPQGATTQRTNDVIAGYNTAYNATFPIDTSAYARIQSMSMTFNPLNLSTPAPVGDRVSTAVTMGLGSKAIQELFENDYGRMNATLGVELKFTNGQNQTTIPYGYVDPLTEIVANTPDIQTASIGTAGDGTQIWKITHNGVDTHPVHFHLFNVQVINRVGWDGAVRPPEENELGWKETVRMNPLEDCIVALRAIAPKQPFGLPDSKRPLNPSMPLGVVGPAGGFFGVDPNGNPITVTNVVANFGWEYVWHCHILSHEEMDMMRPLKFDVARSLPAAPALSTTGTLGNPIILAWTDGTPFDYTTGLPTSTMGNPAGEIGFRIERSDNGGAFAALATSPANTTGYTDSTINVSTWSLYRVVAFNAAGDSPSNIVQLGTPPGLNAPTNLTANLQSGPKVALKWTDNATVETGFVIERSIDGVNFVALATVGPKNNTGTVNYTDSTVTIGQTYTYRVKAVMNLASLGFTASSAYSNTVTVPILVPAAPSGVAVTAFRYNTSSDRATVTWTDVANETGYRIRWSTSATFATGVSTGTVGANVTTFTTGNLPRGTNYYFQVQSFNNITGASAWADAAPSPVLTP